MEMKGLLGRFRFEFVVIGIAVVLLGVLFYGLYDAVFSNTVELEEAEVTLDDVVSRVERVANDPSVNKMTFSMSSPGGWGLLYFSEGEPSDCLGESCLCVCKPSGIFVKSLVGRCDGAGVCRGIGENILMEGEKMIPGGVLLRTVGVGVEVG